MSGIIHFKQTLGDLNLEKIKQQAERSWSSSQTMPTVTVDVLVTEIEQLRRDLHDERVRRDEWKKMYNQVKTSLNHEVDRRVRAELEVEQLQKELELE